MVSTGLSSRISLKRTQVGRGRDRDWRARGARIHGAVLGYAAIADLAVAELAFQHLEHVLDLGAHLAEAAVPGTLALREVVARHIAGTAWSTKRYLNMELLKRARPFARRLFDENPSKGRSRRLAAAFHLTGGEANDSRNFEILLDLGPDIAPRAAITDKGYAAITDKGYDARANRDAARRRGICPVIPFRSNAIDKPAFFPKILYKARARIEQAVGKLKRFKRIALRCEKTAQNYGSFVALAFGFILAKSVHTA